MSVQMWPQGGLAEGGEREGLHILKQDSQTTRKAL